MKFDPKTDEEIAEAGLIPPSEIDFEILTAQEKTSKAGNDMFELSIQVFTADGSERTIRDWIMPSFPKKFKHCLDACGLIAKYNAGEISVDDFVGKTGKLKIEIGKPNDDGIRYNQVHDYVKRAADYKPIDTKKALDGDECPF